MLLKDFFEGYLDYLVQQPEYKSALGVLYAVGDDLFLVGAWDKVIDFALELRKSLDRFTGGNPDFTFSLLKLTNR